MMKKLQKISTVDIRSNEYLPDISGQAHTHSLLAKNAALMNEKRAKIKHNRKEFATSQGHFGSFSLLKEGRLLCQ